MNAITATPPKTPAARTRRTRSVGRRALAVAAISALGLAGLSPDSQAAATTYGVTHLSAQLQGGNVTTSVTITASNPTVAQKLKVCVRNVKDWNLDYPGLINASVDTRGTTTTESKLFPLGTYTYWGCVKVADRWYDVGAKKTFTVAPSVEEPSSEPVSGTAPSPNAMPTASNKAGWKYSYGQDFTTAAPLGQFSKVYGSKWAGYTGIRNDTSRNGSYQPDKVLSVANGKLDMTLGYDAATGLNNVATPFPQPPAGVNGGSAEYLGMRTSIRFRSSNRMPGYKVAWMMWPASWNWDDGEIDFPEATLDEDNLWGFSHEAGTGHPEINALWAKAPASFHEGWHVATTEWKPGVSVEFFLDGVSIGKTTQHVPTKPMHWLLQTETGLSKTPPPQTSRGTISIDWLTVESYQP